MRPLSGGGGDLSPMAAATSGQQQLQSQAVGGGSVSQAAIATSGRRRWRLLVSDGDLREAALTLSLLNGSDFPKKRNIPSKHIYAAWRF